VNKKAVINLSREVDSPSLLPSAFYDLSRYNFSQILEPNEDDPEPHFPCQTASLSLMDIQKLALGKESSHHAITTLIQATSPTWARTWPRTLNVFPLPYFKLGRTYLRLSSRLSQRFL
jgi:hypothetical protein